MYKPAHLEPCLTLPPGVFSLLLVSVITQYGLSDNFVSSIARVLLPAAALSAPILGQEDPCPWVPAFPSPSQHSALWVLIESEQ